MVRGSRTFAITAVAVLALALVVSSVSVVQAQDAEQTATATPTAAAGPPLGDCYGGVLAQNPLHCYALEQAEREKLIDVTALYEAPGDGPLYVWLKQTGPVSDAVYAFLKTKSYDFYDRWPDQVVDDGLYINVCSGGYRACVLDRISWDEDFMLPWLLTYGYAVFHVGGEKTQRQHVAGASWRQLWPNPAGARDVSLLGSTPYSRAKLRQYHPRLLGLRCVQQEEVPTCLSTDTTRILDVDDDVHVAADPRPQLRRDGSGRGGRA